MLISISYILIRAHYRNTRQPSVAKLIVLHIIVSLEFNFLSARVREQFV